LLLLVNLEGLEANKSGKEQNDTKIDEDAAGAEERRRRKKRMKNDEDRNGPGLQKSEGSEQPQCQFPTVVKMYLCFTVSGHTGQVSNADLVFSLGKFYFRSIAYNITVPKVTFKYSSFLSVDTTTHHKSSKIVESHPQIHNAHAQIQKLD